MPSHLCKPSACSELQANIEQTVAIAIAEDIGRGDLTAALIDPVQLASARIISRQRAIVCGIPWVEACYRQLDAGIRLHWQVAEGDSVAPDQLLCEISGAARSMLSAERCALNFLQTLSATATQTRAYVDAVAGTAAKILDTRKTLPGLRLAQKYAVTVGGGMNQRMGLFDGILIKENHIAAAGSIAAVLRSARAIAADVPIQIEVESLPQLTEALQCGADLILLDNFSLDDLAAAVKISRGRALLEASGGIGLDNVRAVALTGVDRISVGGLTKHVQAIDLSMRFNA